MTLRVTTVFGQNPAYADPDQGIIVNVLMRITPDMDQQVARPKDAGASVHHLEYARDVDIVWVQDRSGSMEGEKLRQSKEVLRALIDQLTDADRAGIICFDDQVDIVHDHKQMSAWHRRVACKRVKDIHTRGYTTLAAPLVAAMEMGGKRTRSRTIVMLTDGNSCGDNVNADRDNFLMCAKKLAERSDRLILIGMGTDYDADLLERACAYGPDFELFHISTTDEQQLKQVTQDVMAELRGAVIGKLCIEGEAADGVEIRKLTSFVPRQRDRDIIDDRRFTITSGSLSKHRGQHVLIEMLLKKPRVGMNPLGGITISGVRTDDAGVEHHVGTSCVLEITCTSNTADAKKPVNREVRDCIVRAQAHRLMAEKKYDQAAALYDVIGDVYMAGQARWARRQSELSEVLGDESYRTTMTHSSRTVTTDWTSRGSE